MRINTNISSLNAREAATNVGKNLTNSLEKLSTGLKINKAADDSSGLAIADKLRTQSNSIGQGISNANSAVALIQIADKAMSEQSNILDTIKTKLIQASTSTTSEDGREAIRKDIQKLLEQFDNISGQTNYNGLNLLNEKDKDFVFQVGEDSSFDIGLTTEYAVNTKGLGSAGAESTTQATIKTTTGGSVTLEGEESNVSATVKSTGVDVQITANKADTAADVSDMSVKISADNVTSLKVNTIGGGVIITTDDAKLANFLNKEADKSTSDELVKIGNGVYSFKSTSGTAEFKFTNNAAIDLKDLKISNLSSTTEADAVFTVTTKEAVTVEKISGSGDIKLDTSTAATSLDVKVNGDTSKGIASTTAKHMIVTDGTVAIQSNSTATDALDVVAINSIEATTASEVSINSFTVASDEKVKSISLRNTAAEGTVTISTTDGNTAQALRDAGLTENKDGSFTWSTNGVDKTNKIEFGSEGIDIKNLKFEGVDKNTTSNDVVFIETTGTVTIANNKPENASGKFGQFSVALTTSETAANFEEKGIGLGELSSGLAFKNLEGLAAIGENELTSETANNFMSVIDDALTQLNSVRSDFGATQNQLDSAIRNMTTVQTNIKAAESIIRDVDYAQESANFNKQNIISQAGSYAMSQANAIQQNVLRLLQ